MQFFVGYRKQTSFLIIVVFSLVTVSSSVFGIELPSFLKSSPKPVVSTTENIESQKIRYVRIIPRADGSNEVSCVANKSDILDEDSFIKIMYDPADESVCVVNDESQQKSQINPAPVRNIELAWLGRAFIKAKDGKLPIPVDVDNFNKIVANIAKMTDMGADTDLIDKIEKLVNDPNAAEKMNWFIDKLDTMSKKRREELEVKLDKTGDKIVDSLLVKINKQFAPGGRIHELMDSLRELAVKKVLKDVVVYSTLAALGIATAFQTSRVFWNYVERQLHKPRLFIEYYKHRSVRGLLKYFQKPIALPTMVLPSYLEKWFDDYITELIATREANDRGDDVKYRTMLMFGKPGTGKTMKAKEIAYRTRFNFAFMTGSSLFQDGAGIEGIDEVFAYLEKSDTPTVLFIDEADSLFVDRTTMDPTSLNYKIVNHLLNYLGTRSSKYVVILTTNHLKQFDAAMQRRVDEVIEMPLPDRERRIDALKLYINKLLGAVNNVDEVFTEIKLAEIALMTAGFCYGDFEGIINKIKSKVLVTKNLTTELVDSVVQEFCDKQVAFALAE